MVDEKKYLLSTYWTQKDKVIGCGCNESLENGIDFNQYAPLDFYNSEAVRSYTGCASTAMSQVIYYHLTNDFLNEEISYNIKADVLNEQDAYVSFANIPALTLYISANGNSDAGILSFKEINEKLSVFVPAPGDDDVESSLAAADYIAALNFTVGVLLKAKYSDVFETGAAFSENVFLRCGFQSASHIDPFDMESAERSLWITEDEQITDEALEILIENLENGQPVVFGIPGHGIVLDGYDRKTDTFHINYGMGPDSEDTRWYTRDEFKQLKTIGLVMDISPTYQETFTVTSNNVFGSGTLLRVVQQAAAMQGANIIAFDNALADADAVELPVEVTLTDKTIVSGFNMTFFSAAQDIAGGDDENEADDPSEDDGESKEEDENPVAIFHGDTGSKTEFIDFRGNIICNTQENSQSAAFHFANAVQLTVSTSNANIYAGVSQLENSEILDKMVSGSLDEPLENCQLKVAFVGSDGDDKITLDEETIVIGDLDLSAGHDTLTVTGNSTIYGDIDVGSGDNTITISAGSSIHGNLQGEAELVITLGGTDTDVIFNITGDADSTFENITSITVDATNAEAAEYTLFNKGNADVLLEKLLIKGDGGIIVAEDGSIKWSADKGDAPVAEEEDEPEKTVIAAGETVIDAAIKAEELWIFQDGSIASGSLSIEEEGEVKVMTGAKFIFDISSMSTENSTAIINNYSGINGTFHFAINVAMDQEYGNYILAENVEEWDFNTPISVTAENIILGSFESGEGKVEFTCGDNHYELVYNEENKSLALVIDSAFQTAIFDDDSIKLSWHNPAGASGYFLNLSHGDGNGTIQIFSEMNALNIVTAVAGEYEWQVLAPGLETEFREGGSFSVGEAGEECQEEVESTNSHSTLYDAGTSDNITDVFMAESSGIWSKGYIAKHAELPDNWNDAIAMSTRIELAGKSRYADIFKGADGDFSILYLSDSANGDALFLDDVYSAFPDQNKCERIADISRIYAGAGDDIVDLTTNKFDLSAENIKVYGGSGDDVIWTGKDTACTLFGDEGNDSLIGSTKDDCFIGGAGDDVMHGGGGDDIFAYGDPATWGNDIIYQLNGENDIADLFFEQSDLKDKIKEESIDGGVRFTVEGYENSSITFYGKYYSLVFGDDCNKLEAIVSGGGCGDHASEKIFEDKKNGMLA